MHSPANTSPSMVCKDVPGQMLLSSRADALTDALKSAAGKISETVYQKVLDVMEERGQPESVNSVLTALAADPYYASDEVC